MPSRLRRPPTSGFSKEHPEGEAAMMPIVLFVALLVIGAAALLAAALSWRSRHVAVRWLGLMAGGLVALITIVIGLVGLLGVYRLSASRGRATTETAVASSPALVARGERLANMCAACHSRSNQPPLDGGQENFLASQRGTLYAPNLTPAGPLKDWSDDEIVRAIREGVDREARPLLIMPSEHYHAMSDADVHAIVAYLRSQPAVVHETPPAQMGAFGTILVGVGAFPTAAQPAITGPVSAPPAGPT